MAWVNWSDRFGDGKESAEGGLGPGAYLGHSSHLSQGDPAYAPFGSLRPRARSNENASGVPIRAGPSPGEYDPRLPAAFDAGLPKKSAPFGSTGQRPSHAKKDSHPGPGQYAVGHRFADKESSRTMGQPHTEPKQLFRSVSAPSIPARHQSFGYEEVGDGRLVQQGPKNPKGLLSGRPKDSAGPGQYEVHHGNVPVDRRVQGGTFLKCNRSKDAKASDTPGPGHYVAAQDPGRICSSAFQSQSDRGWKVRDDGPAPGQYYKHTGLPPGKYSREVNPDLQYFGSTTERFRDPGLDPDPGPGSYALPKKHVRLMTKPFSCSAARFQGPSKRDRENPGPGNYDPAGSGATVGPIGSVSVLGAVGGLAFGSMERKGSTFGGKSDIPGPGAYSVPPVIHDYEADAVAETKTSATSTAWRKPRYQLGASFKSATPKDYLSQSFVKGGKNQPPPGAYDPVHKTDIGSVMRMPGKSEGFLSTAERISSGYKKVHGGPGQYDAPIEVTAGKKAGSFNRSILEGGHSNTRSRSLGFDGGDQRFKTQVQVKRNPGPGHYPTADGWNKRTYNIHFGDVL